MKLAVSSAVGLHFLQNLQPSANMYKTILYVHKFNFDPHINQTVKITKRVTEIHLSIKQLKDKKFQWVTSHHRVVGNEMANLVKNRTKISQIRVA
jgi:hypothetical protein